MTNGKIESFTVFIHSLNASSLMKKITDIFSWPTWDILLHHLENSLNVSESFSVVGFAISPHFVAKQIGK